MAVLHKIDSIIGINKKKEEENKRVKELEAKIEADKQTQAMANMAIFELYSEIENLKNEKVNE